MSLVRYIELDEDERKHMLKLRSRQEAMELFIASGAATEQHMTQYQGILNDVNELKRNLLLSSGELDQNMFDYTFYFDTVSGMVWVEDAEE